tara:strand:- start:328 stop:672 length:345 start_codon:yes stop_codon:yes gene_type:complete
MKILEDHRPWGRFLQFTKDENSTVKILEVKPGEMLSLQSHKQRKEFWYVIEGNPTVLLNDKKIKLKGGEHVRVGKRVKHRIINRTKKIVKILEIATGQFDENDIVRYEDKYKRV